MPGNAGKIADQVGEDSRAASGSPPVRRSLRTPKAANRRARRTISSNDKPFLRLQESIVLVELLLRHAVGAAEIAAVHDRDAQIVQRPAEAIERMVRATNVVNGGTSWQFEVTTGTCW